MASLQTSQEIKQKTSCEIMSKKMSFKDIVAKNAQETQNTMPSEVSEDQERQSTDSITQTNEDSIFYEYEMYISEMAMKLYELEKESLEDRYGSGFIVTRELYNRIYNQIKASHTIDDFRNNNYEESDGEESQEENDYDY